MKKKKKMKRKEEERKKKIREIFQYFNILSKEIKNPRERKCIDKYKNSFKIFSTTLNLCDIKDNCIIRKQYL